MRLFLAAVIRWLTSLPWSDFLRVVSAAASASGQWTKDPGMTDAQKEAVNEARNGYVRGWIARNLPFLTGWKLNVILELAVGWLNRTAK